MKKELMTEELFVSLGARKEDESYYMDGDKIHNSNSYFFVLNSAKIQVRHFFKEGEFIVWIKYNYNGIQNINAEELKFYENQFIKKCKNLTKNGFIKLVEALTGEELTLK